MSRNGSGVYSLPGTYQAVSGETIEAQQHNDPLRDLESDANTARPIVAGGTGATTATGALANLGAMAKAGTTTNDDAAAGDVGEYISASVASGSAAAMSNGSTVNLTSITLTPGDWDVSLNIAFTTVSVTASQFIASISTTSASLDVSAGMSDVRNLGSASVGSTTQNCIVGPVRFSVSANTTVYGVSRASFSAGSVSFYGLLSARRVR